MIKSQIYDHIRMLDADGYPPAFIRLVDFKLEFTKANKKPESIEAKVRITKEINNESF